jgi:hypothetical protein
MGIWDKLSSPEPQSEECTEKDITQESTILNICESLKEKTYRLFKNGLAEPLIGFLTDYISQTKKFTMSKTFFIYNLEKASSMDNSPIRKHLYT